MDADRILLEVCVDDVHGLAAAFAGGADRIELCAALGVGGLTPSPGLLRAASAVALPVYAMVRPRAGHFRYDEAEIQHMLSDIDAIRDAGLAGVVLGASAADGRLDHATLERLLRRADGLGTTLHRAIDCTPDLAEATRTAIGLGFERILTSGGASSAVDGIAGLLACHAAADGRIAILPGAGIHAGNVAALLAQLPTDQIHASCSSPSGSDHDAKATNSVRTTVVASAPWSDPEVAATIAFPAWSDPEMTLGFEWAERRQTSREKVAALKAACAAFMRQRKSCL